MCVLPYSTEVKDMDSLTALHTIIFSLLIHIPGIKVILLLQELKPSGKFFVFFPQSRKP